jgi:hypothetical protein
MLGRSTCILHYNFCVLNIVYIESCMYKSDLRKINKLQQKKNTEIIFNAWLGVKIMYPCRETCLPVDYCLRRV